MLFATTSMQHFQLRPRALLAVCRHTAITLLNIHSQAGYVLCAGPHMTPCVQATVRVHADSSMQSNSTVP